MRFVLPCLLIIRLWSPAAFGQDAAVVTRFAANCAALGDYEQSLLEYQRVIFFLQDKTPDTLLFQAALVAREASQYELARQYLNNTESLSTDDSLISEAQLAKSAVLIYEQKWQEALIELFELELTADSVFWKRIHFLKAISYFRLEKYAEAEQHFLASVPAGDETTKTAVRAQFANPENFKRPLPNRAYILSAFFPGLGQAYAGDYRQALNSVALTALLVVLTRQVYLNYGIYDALFTIVPWMQRYYVGGMQKAKRIAARKREVKRQEVLLNITRLYTAQPVGEGR